MAEINRVIRMTLGLDNQGKETEMDIRSLFSAFRDNIVRLFVSDVAVADNKITVTKSGSTKSYDLPAGLEVDSELSDTSTNPVQNKVVKAAIPTKVSQLANDNGYISDVTWDAIADKPTEFTPAAHNQDSSTITEMTGYNKPDATSAIVSSDTLNGAIGKVERALDDKADKATTLAGYGIVDAYTKTETDTELDKKQDVISDLAEIRTNAATGAGLSTQVSDNANNISSLQTALGDYLPLAGGVITGDILPSVDNTVSLGNSDKRFKEIYTHELKLSTNSLYLGDTKIMGTDANTINIKADAGQSIAVKTQGSGVTNIQSFTGVSIETVAENGTNPDGSNIKIKAMGDGSSITMIAPTIGVTGATTISNLTVTGNLTVAGTTTTVNSTNLEIKDNIIEINKGETGSGVSAGTAGVKIDRGENTDFFVVFDELDDKLKIGIGNENLTPVATESYVDTAVSTKMDVSGTAISAEKLTVNAGGNNQPVYFSGGVPVATLYELNATVPSDAKFTDTTYTAKDGIELVDGEFINTGVRAVASGTANGTVSVNTNGVLEDVAVTGLGSAAFTDSADYAESVHAHGVADVTGLAAVATSGSYTDLTDTPVIPAEYTHPETHPASMITGLSIVATSGSYNDLADKPTIPTEFPLPDATTTTKGGVIVGSNITVADAVISLTKDNVTNALGYTPPVVNTTYSAGTGISFNGTTINNSGVRSVATGTANGTISVNTNGTSADVAVKGLGSAAYTASSAYAAASHTHSYASVTKVTFTASDSKWGSASGGYYPLTLANSGKNLFAVYRTNGSNYDRVAVSDTVSGSNNIVYSLEKFAGYALFI